VIINVEPYANKSHENSEMAAGLHITEDSTLVNDQQARAGIDGEAMT
jgi:hypothetical protein